MSVIIGLPIADKKLQYNDVCIGNFQLKAILKENGIPVKMADFSDFSEKEFCEAIRNEKPAIITLRCLTCERKQTIKCLKLVKEIDPSLVTIIGGPHASVMYEQMLLNYDCIDYIVIGEADNAFPELVRRILSGKDISDVKGIAYRYADNIRVVAGKEVINNIDSIPFPDYDYEIQKKRVPIRKIFLSICRGCPGDCTFCSSNTIWGKQYRSLCIESVIERIKFYMDKYKTNRIHFCDDTINSSKKRIIDLCQAIINENLNIEWSSAARVDRIDDEIIYWMKKSGCIRLELGVESGSHKIREKMRKKITNEQIVKAFELCRQAGIESLAFILWGYPDENVFDKIKTVALIKKIRPDRICLSICSYLPGTELTEILKAKNRFSDSSWLDLENEGYMIVGKFHFFFILIINKFVGIMLKRLRGEEKLGLNSKEKFNFEN